MNRSGFRVEPADWKSDRDALRAIRETVFIREQQVPVEEEWDDLDVQCRHVIARSDDNMPIGTGRLTPQHTIGRMAVLPAWRGHGVGAALLQALLEQAMALGWEQVSLHAQVQAIGFYRRHGFVAEGEPFMEAGIEHRTMRRRLQAARDARTAPSEAPARTAGNLLQTNSCADLADAVLTLVGDARHTVCMHHRDLAPGVLDREDVLEALRCLALSGRGAGIRMLLADPDQILRDGHRLVPLVQRLPSVMHLRVPQEDEDRAYPSAFFLNDAGGYLMLPMADRFEGRGSTHNPGTARPLQRYFDEVWERAAPATVLRQLGL